MLKVFFLVKLHLCNYVLVIFVWFYFIVGINAIHTLLSTLLDFLREIFTRISRYFAKSCYSLRHLNAMRITINESRTAGNEKFHRRIKMTIIYSVTIVPNSMSYLPTKIGILSQKLFSVSKTFRKGTRACATVP